MVAKKTAAEKSASAESTGATAKDRTDSKSTVAPGTTAKKAAVKKVAAVKKAPAKKASAKKAAPAKKAVPAKKAAKKAATAAAGAAQAAEQTGAKTVVAKKTATARKPAESTETAVPKARTVAAAVPGELAVRPGEDPWTPDEVADARAELQSEDLRLGAEIAAAEAALAGLMRDSGDGAGDDQADTGTKNITRESEMALAANAQEMLEQTERALERLESGTYGICENCGNPIGKARMQAFPRATLCVECKQKQERRY
ncbi:TraR/DksA family transcriptional regulator [Streptomyces beijiangensis]|uniref:TraR/DksA C4-type zinc finger protein n=1 Tax=Streptomyces beijiangensis TaxID=163361 RepID=A0A939FCA7_9ACTN|nr:TraR/DksA C4-type zinc finger protein [Streptomyces beijiangensis]MBO0514812.1 TraR/DksA C4-type zinc finger protein [Streptomyces beijiangensis]